MTAKEKITEILKAYTKKHNISASTVILEEYAEELVKQGVIVPVMCKDCRYCKPTAVDGIMACIRNSKYIKPTDYCSYGERCTKYIPIKEAEAE